MGLLATNTRIKIASGQYTIEQNYLIAVPIDAAGTSYQSKTIHMVSSGIKSVTDHGVMVREGFNQSISNPGNLKFGEYHFQVSNLDGSFNPEADLWIHGTSDYVAAAHECKVTRWTSVIVGTAAAMIDGCLYNGKIDRVEYTNKSMGKPKSAAIFCAPFDLEKLTGITWGKDDYDEYDLSSVGFFVAPLPENN